MGAGAGRRRYGQSPQQDSGFQRVLLKQNLIFKGWNSHAHREVPGIMLSQRILVGTILVGRLGVGAAGAAGRWDAPSPPAQLNVYMYYACMHACSMHACVYVYIYIYICIVIIIIIICIYTYIVMYMS